MIGHRSTRRAVLFALCLVVATLACAGVAHAAVTGMERVSLNGPSGQVGGITGSTSCDVSADGRFVVFESDSATLSPKAYYATDQSGVGGLNVYLRDRQLGTTTLVSRPAAGDARTDGPSHKPVISADGRYVVFASAASNLITVGDTVTNAGIYRWDRTTGGIERVDLLPTQGAVAWNASMVANSSDWWYAAVSDDGRFVAYAAPASAGSSVLELYRRDMALFGGIDLVSVGRIPGAPGVPAYHPAISADGSKVAFATSANLFSLSASGRHVFLRDLTAGTTTLVSAPHPLMPSAQDRSDWPSMNASATLVAFASQSSNLVTMTLSHYADDPSAYPWNVYVRDTGSGLTEILSVGTLGESASDDCLNPTISSDGRYVAFQSGAENLKVDGSKYWYYALLVRDRVAGTFSAIAPQTMQPYVNERELRAAAFSGDARYVAFASGASDLVSGDTNSVSDVFLYSLRPKKTTTLSTPTLKTATGSTSYIRRYRTFTIYGKVYGHAGSSAVVEIRIYRRLSTGTTRYRTYTLTVPVSSTGYGSFKKSLTLPYTGKWCVRTYHAECDDYLSKYSSYKYFTVYR